MAETPIFEVITYRYLIKYLYRNLHPRTQKSTRWGPSLSAEVAKLLPLHIMVCGELPQEHARKGSITLGIGTENMLQLAPSVQQQLIALVSLYFREDFLLTTDTLHRGPMKLKIADAINMFRREYDITEDDYPLVNSYRTYQRFRRARRISGPRGKPPRHTYLRRIGAPVVYQ